WEWDDGQVPLVEWYRVYVLLPLDRTDRLVELWDDLGVWDDGGLWQDDREDEVEIVRAILRQHKPVHAVISGIFIALSGGYWDFPGDLWDGGPEDVWDSDQIERTSFLPYLSGVGFVPVTLTPSGSFGAGTVSAPAAGEPRTALSVRTGLQQLLDQTG